MEEIAEDEILPSLTTSYPHTTPTYYPPPLVTIILHLSSSLLSFHFCPILSCSALSCSVAEEKQSLIVEMTRIRSGQELYHKYPCLGCVFWLLFGTSFSPRLMRRWIDELKSFHMWKQVTPLDRYHILYPYDPF